MKKREEIEAKYKWDLTDYFKTEKEWDDALKNLKPMVEELTTYEGKLFNDAKLLECLNLSRRINFIIEKLFVYISLKIKEDATNEFYQNKANKLEKFSNEISPKTSFISSEVNEISDAKLLELSQNPLFKDYDLYFKDIIKDKSHMLSKQEEKLLSVVGECIGGDGEVFDMLDSVDIKFDDVIDSKGKKHPLNNSNYTLYIRSKDKKMRETAYNNMIGAYGKLNFTLSANYLNNVKTDCTFAKVRKFSSAFVASLFSEDVDESVYSSLVLNVTNNLKSFYRYFELKRETLGLDVMHNYDVHAEFEMESKTNYTYEQAFDLVKKTLAVFGNEYVNVLDKAKNEQWIDVMPNENKDTGAFSWGAYGAHPVVLLNFEGTVNDVFTLAHELGHMMHTYYSNKTQIFNKAGYEIFVAEVASTVNEMILAKTLLKDAKTKKEKLFYIDYMLNMCYGTICRQTMFAEFEYNIHKAYEDGGETTAQAIDKLYYDLGKKYFGTKVELSDCLKYEWSMVPHFYTSFYVYKYATGLISALAISEKILSGEKDAVENYLKFLTLGSTMPPVELLKIAGADLTKEETFKNAFDFINSILDMWESLK